MATRNLIHRIKELSTEQKFAFWGSLLVAASVFFPWYSDLDAFKTGDTFLGITGPLYLAGILMFGIGATSLATTLHRNTREKIERIFSSIGNFYLISAGFSGFLLLLADSIYLHPNFGVNIAIKELRIGMLIGLAGVVALAFGGYLLRKRQHSHRHIDIDSNLEPLIKMPEHDAYIERAVERTERVRTHGVVTERRGESSAISAAAEERQNNLF